MRTIESICLLLSCMLLMSIAEAGDKRPIRIESDSMHLDMDTGTSTYTGNVKLERDGFTLTGDRIIIDRDQATTTIRLYGEPARYTQNTTGQTTSAQSRSMLFDDASNVLTMKTDAKLDHDNQLIESSMIKFDTVKQVLLAGGNHAGTPDQRVNIILNPDENTD